MKSLRLSGLVFSFAAIIAAPAYSWATTCFVGTSAPQLLLNAENTVPENIGGIPWIGGFDPVTVERVDGTELVAVESTMVFAMSGDLVLIKPSDWAEGNSYRVSLEGTDIDRTIEVIEPFLLSGKPTLSVFYDDVPEEQNVKLLLGVISMSRIAALEDPEISPYLTFETFVNDVPWSSAEYCAFGPHFGLSPWGPGVEHLLGHCSPGSGGGGYFEASSVLEVSMRVRMIGLETSLTTPAIVVDFPQECADYEEQHPEYIGRPYGDDDNCSSVSGISGLSFLGFIGMFGFVRRRINFNFGGGK